MGKVNGATTKGIESWEVDEDLRTLCRCDQIKADPKRHKAAMDLGKKRMMEYAAVASEGKDKD